MLRAKLTRDDLPEASYDLEEAVLTVSFSDGSVFHHDHAKETDFNSIIASEHPSREYEHGFLPRYERDRARRVMRM